MNGTDMTVDVNVHNPRLRDAKTHQVDASVDSSEVFHTLVLKNARAMCSVTLFIDGNWEAWDAIVAAVESYRDGPCECCGGKFDCINPL